MEVYAVNYENKFNVSRRPEHFYGGRNLCNT